MGGYTSHSGSSRDYDFRSKPAVTKRSASSYAKSDNRQYTSASRGLPSPVRKDISTNEPYALTVVLDVTASMEEWPELIFTKAPALYTESNAVFQGAKLNNLEKNNNLEDKLDLSFIAVGDAGMHDRYPLQVVEFCKGAKFIREIKKIYQEKGGGGNAQESYDLAAYYLLNHCETPNIKKPNKPLLIIVGDEGFYNRIIPDLVKKHIGDNLTKGLATKDIMHRLKDKFDTYVLRPQGLRCYDPLTYNSIHEQWVDVLGSQRVLKMNKPERLIDEIIGLCGIAADNFIGAKDLLKRRQTPEQVSDVLNDLHPALTLHENRKKSGGEK